MSDRYSVRWAEAAVRDLEEIARFISSDSSSAARALLARIRSLARSLSTSPRRGRIVPELAGLGLVSWRELVLAPYRLLYRIHEREVHVLAIFDGRRALEDVLLERLIR